MIALPTTTTTIVTATPPPTRREDMFGLMLALNTPAPGTPYRAVHMPQAQVDGVFDVDPASAARIDWARIDAAHGAEPVLNLDLGVRDYGRLLMDTLGGFDALCEALGGLAYLAGIEGA